MMRATLSDGHNPNYVATMVLIPKIEKHPHADNLSITSIFENTVIVNSNTKVGDKYVYFPAESALNKDFLKFNNLFENSELNSDTSKHGYINRHGRVRTLKLRRVFSKGILLPLTYIENWLNTKIEFIENFDFDTVNTNLLVQKYLPAFPKNSPKAYKEKNYTCENKKVGFHTIVKGQFKLHYDTLQLGKNLRQFNDGDFIHISKKYHGTSGIAANVLMNTKMNPIKRFIYNLLGINTAKYEYIATSRKVFKELSVDEPWGAALEHFKEFLTPGMAIYYEAVGYYPNSQKMIQKGYDYGYKTGETGFKIYRITTTDLNGNVDEWTPDKIKSFCLVNNKLEHVGFYLAKINFNAKYNIEETNSDLLDLMEKNDPECKNIVAFEGVCVRRAITSFDNNNENMHLNEECFKLKADKFFAYETAVLDEGINLDIE